MFMLTSSNSYFNDRKVVGMATTYKNIDNNNMICHVCSFISSNANSHNSGMKTSAQFALHCIADPGHNWPEHSRLIAMVDILGLLTIFFTHSAADLQWLELARLICPDDPDSSSSSSKALQENPAIANWFFHHHIEKFVDAFHVGILGAIDFWFCFELQHRGKHHVHGLAWLHDAPNVE